MGDGRNAGSTLPPGPSVPGALQAWTWMRRPLRFLERCHRRYGDTFTLRIGHVGTWVVLSDPEDVKRVFTADPTRIGVSEANPVLGPLLGHRSVMLLEEPEHLFRRKLILPPFHGRQTERTGAMMADIVAEEIARWPLGEPFALWPRMRAITLEVVLRIVFGAHEGAHMARLRTPLHALTDWLNHSRRLTLLAVLGPRWIASNPGFRQARERVGAAVLDEVRRRRAAVGDAPPAAAADVVALLLAARYEDGTPLSDEDLVDELITLLSDGPTSTSLAWAFERLLRYPEQLARLTEEVRAGESDAYLDAVVKETLRCCPTVPVVVRRLLAPMHLGGASLPAGTVVAPCVYLVHRRADVYPEPERFAPERFLGQAAGTYTWIPFGGGVRRCLAASFALQEMKQVLRTVLRAVELRPAGARVERAARSSIAFAPDRRAQAIVVPRRTPRAALAGAAPATAGAPAE